MRALDVVDETFLAAPPAAVAARIAGPGRWRRWWPDLRLTVAHDRGPQGVRWTVDGALRGTLEIWLEPVLDGTVLHLFLRSELPDGADVGSELGRRRRQAKAVAFELKADLEAGRPAGEPPAAVDA
ncbi:polyketide cyclase / dehydrase and lipid transport [Rhodococcus antarcticus]|uniref:Polyketide cyclase / dehydrase and lipid transport n=1 Tax=Rhodococcus antarcticus TaxID=2987751 RepID=A0ABY6NX51_9NOCA|nr:polyketide cyclase / dehydrase and lipid transport [Rhodococcus antarcticus]UZJ23563.1 polyketide cyclase / dehydrase and lipid transport [Rhodococcus antarcticus]